MSKNIYYNSAVAKRCGRNGIIKAVLINYIYHYNKLKPREGVGSPACISLAEFVYQYKYSEKETLWKKSFIQEVLSQSKKDKLIFAAEEKGRLIYTVSPEIIKHLTAEDAAVVSFDLGAACKFGIEVAVIHRHLSQIINKSPVKKAYNLNIKQMSNVNKISVAQIYRAIQFLKEAGIFEPVESPLKRKSRAMSLGFKK